MILTLPDLSRESLGKAFHQIVDAPLDKSKAYYLELKEGKPSRSAQQNRYYWGVLLPPLCQETGYMPEELHNLLGIEFRQTEMVDFRTGEVIRAIRSTTSYNVAEMTDYLELVIRWAAETFPDCRFPEEIY